MDTWPLVLGVGVLFFVACAVVGLVFAVFAFKRKARWFGLLIAAVGLPGLFPLLLEAPPLAPSLQSVSGTYRGTFGGGENTLVLRPDQTYDQRFVSNAGKVYNNHGTWRLDTRRGGVHFNHFLDTTGRWGGRQKPKVIEGHGGILRLLSDSIYLDPDGNDALHRIKS